MAPEGPEFNTARWAVDLVLMNRVAEAFNTAAEPLRLHAASCELCGSTATRCEAFEDLYQAFGKALDDIPALLGIPPRP